MIEVHPGLYVGEDSDAVTVGNEPGWFVVHAAKEPYHRAALGYKTVGAPKTHPEYYAAHRPGCVILNLVDVPVVSYIASEAVNAGIDAIEIALGEGCKVLVHCNQGQSRGPTIAFLYMALRTDLFDACTYEEAVARFTEIYPAFAPNGGMAGYARNVWNGEADLPSGQMKPVFQEPRLDSPDPPDDVAPRLAPRSPRPALFRF